MQTVPTNGLNAIILTTSYPIIAKETDPDRRKKMYVSIFKKFNFLHSLLVFFLIGISDFIFYYIFGEKWLPSSPLFKLFMILTLAYPMKTVNANIVKLVGKSNIYRNLTLLRTGLQTTALLICAPISINIILIGQIIAAFLSVSIDMYVCGKQIQWNVTQQYKEWIKIIWIPLCSYIISLIIADNLSTTILSQTIIWLCCFLLSFTIICRITNSENFIYFWNTFSKKH